MHEYHKPAEFVTQAAAQAEKQGKRRVTALRLVVGEASGYNGESIRLHFEQAAAGTVCEGARLEITPVPALLSCPDCGAQFPRKPFSFACPDCGGQGVPGEAGREIYLESVETA